MRNGVNGSSHANRQQICARPRADRPRFPESTSTPALLSLLRAVRTVGPWYKFPRSRQSSSSVSHMPHRSKWARITRSVLPGVMLCAAAVAVSPSEIRALKNAGSTVTTGRERRGCR